MPNHRIFSVKIPPIAYLFIPILLATTVIPIIFTGIRIASLIGTEHYLLFLDIISIVLCIAVLSIGLSAILCIQFRVTTKGTAFSFGMFRFCIKTGQIEKIIKYSNAKKICILYRKKNPDQYYQMFLPIVEQDYDEAILAIMSLSSHILYEVNGNDLP